LWDYEKQKKLGLDPTFDPVALDIKNATFWENYDPATGKERQPTSTA
ncbi:sodium:alanine symporter, partial [Mycobacterium sp. ITM-2017-0098]